MDTQHGGHEGPFPGEALRIVPRSFRSGSRFDTMTVLRFFFVSSVCTLCAFAQTREDVASPSGQKLRDSAYDLSRGFTTRTLQAVEAGDLSAMGGDVGQILGRTDIDRSLLRLDIARSFPCNGRMFPPDSGIRSSEPLPFAGYDPDQTRVRWTPTIILGSALALTITGIHYYQMNAWWKDQRGPFHIMEDDAYALNIDKAGHFFGGAFCAFVGRKSMEWCGFSRNTSVITGALMSFLFEMYVELEDGFARKWGFSPGDAMADLIGAAWPVGQHFVPYLENFQPKFSYWPSKELREGTSAKIFIDDYNGQSYWMGMRVYELLPSSWQKFWPSWLGLAVGVSVRGVQDSRTDVAGSPIRHVFLALDYDMTKIIPGDSWFLDTLAKAMNYIHFPAPAIQISPGYIAYGLYF